MSNGIEAAGWTKETPTEPNYYWLWVLHDASQEFHIVLGDFDGEFFRSLYDGSEREANKIDGQWLKLERPQPPQAKPKPEPEPKSAFALRIEALAAFVPQIVFEADPKDSAYVSFPLELGRCVHCGKIRLRREQGIFGLGQTQLAAWAKAAGLVKSSQENPHWCVECVEAGLLTFTCAICQQDRPVGMLHKKILDEDGDVRVQVCTGCYSTLSAKDFDDRIEALERLFSD